MSHHRSLTFPIVVALCGGFGCSLVLGEPPLRDFAFTIRVAADDGAPIQGTGIVTSGSPSAVTNASGEAVLRVTGHEGDRRAFSVHCPKDYESPAHPLLISLHQNAENGRAFVYTATCVPLRRTAVVAVRLDGGPNLPVYYLDEEVARTDESGAAHFAVKVASGEPFRVSVRTIDEDLRPQNPSVELSVGMTDDIVLFDQKLTRVTKHIRSERTKPRLPTRL